MKQVIIISSSKFSLFDRVGRGAIEEARGKRENNLNLQVGSGGQNGHKYHDIFLSIKLF
jgi:hypothetical protein